jgi:hypothetical protein
MLGITTGAVRIRLARGTLPRVRDGGTVYVLLPADMSRDTGDVPTGMLHGAPDTLTSPSSATGYATSKISLRPSARPTPKSVGCWRPPSSASRPSKLHRRHKNPPRPSR